MDLRGVDTVHSANRFLIYAMYPQCNISIHVNPLRGDRVEFAIGKSIFNRTAKVDLDALTLEYGGGGHEAVGSCQAASADADRVLGELIAKIRAAR